MRPWKRASLRQAALRCGKFGHSFLAPPLMDGEKSVSHFVRKGVNPGAGCASAEARKGFGAKGGTRTPTAVKPLAPETSASTSSATFAVSGGIAIFRDGFRNVNCLFEIPIAACILMLPTKTENHRCLFPPLMPLLHWSRFPAPFQHRRRT